MFLAEATLIDQLLGPVIAAVAASAAALIWGLFKKISNKLGLEVKANEEKLIQEAIERAVAKTMQTFVDGVKKETLDGKLTKEDAARALSLTKEEAKKQICALLGQCDSAKKAVEDDAALESRIEAAVPMVKAKTTMAAKGLTLEEAKKLVEDMSKDKKG